MPKKSDRKDESTKHKHKKIKKNKKKRQSQSSSSESGSDSLEWVEAPAPAAKADTSSSKREDWMHNELFVPTLSKEEMASTSSGTSSREKKKAIQKEKQEREETIKHSRELNPYWKDNGTGLPEEDSAPAELTLPSSCVGDGGYTYLRKAWLRLQEQAQETGRSMEFLAVERWGSLSKLATLIDAAYQRLRAEKRYARKMAKRSRRSSSSPEFSRKSSNSPERFRKPGDSPSPERSKHQFQKPHADRGKKMNVSSSRDHRRRYSPLRDSDDEKSPPRRSKRDDPEASGFEPREEKRIPSWKKVRPEATVTSRDDDTSQPSYSGGSSKSRYEFKEERRAPSWRKVKHEEELPSTSRAFTSEKSRRSPPSASEPGPSDEKGPRSPQQNQHTEIHSEDDLNRMAAKYLKADMLGDKELAARLKAELEEARARFKEQGGDKGGAGAPKKEVERVMLTKMDSGGVSRPVKSNREDAGFDRRADKAQKKSNKYLEDGSRYSLKQMFEREKLTTAEDNLEMFLDVAAQAKDGDEENETSGISKKALQKMAHGVQEEKDIGKAIRQHQKLSAALEKCEHCLDQPNMKRHLIVSISEEVYLCLPNFQTIAEGHCLIVPKRHVSSFLHLDEDEWLQVEELRGLLRRFFRSQQKSVVCLETSSGFGRCPHAFMECIPVPEEEGDMAPIYFKKAILESEEEWAHNVKLVDLTSKGLRRSVPKNLPYFCVLFDPSVHAGFAHVIEDEKSFPRNFGKEVLGGMMDIDYNFLYKNRKDDALKKSNEALEFTRALEKFKEDL